MFILRLLVLSPFLNMWYIAVPEALYITLIALRLLGPLGILAWPAYSVAFFCYPVPTMIGVGAVALANATVIIVRNIAGDKIANDKEAGIDDGSNGIPRMTGENKDDQEALDRMHE